MNNDTDKPEPPRHFGDTDLGQAIGLALIILAILLGMGGCDHLCWHAFRDRPVAESKP